MKILISGDGPHAFSFVRNSLAKVFHYCGHEVQMYDVSSSPYEIFQRFQPHLFIGQTYNLNDATLACLKRYQTEHIILRGFDYGEQGEYVDKNYYKIEFARPYEIELTKKLQEETGKLRFVFNHYAPQRIMECMGYWQEKEGIPVKSSMLGADAFNYWNTEFKEHYASDLSMIGSWHEYKSINLAPYLINLNQIKVGDRKLKCKFYSTWNWPNGMYMGQIPYSENGHALRSATIAASIHEPHSTTYGTDIEERPFYSAMCNTLVISDYVESLEKDVFNKDEIVFARSVEEFQELVKHFVKYPGERQAYIRRARKCVEDNHTYFHRVADIFGNLGLKEDQNNTKDLYERFKKEMSIQCR